MSYKPEGVSLPTSPNRFKKSNSNSNFNQQPRSRLVVVDGYDLSRGVIEATEVDTGRKIEAEINPDKAGSIRSKSDKWNGNIIDERMEGHLPVGQRIVLENCITVKKIKSGGQEEKSIMRCNWVSSMPDQHPDKSFTGLFTVNSYKDKISGVQVWDRKSINPSSDEGEEEIESLSQKMNEVVDRYKQSPKNARLITHGVQFRTLVAKGEAADGRLNYEVVDCSPPFDWVRAKKDAEGNIISDGHPLSGDRMIVYLEEYLDHVYGKDGDEDLPGLVAEGIISKDDKFHVEVMTYNAISAAPLSNSMDITNTRSPLYKLSSVLTKYGQLDDSGYVGKNWAVFGVGLLTSDQSPKNRGEDFVDRNLVTRLFVNGFGNNIHSMVPTFDGGKAKAHPSLDRVRDNEASTPALSQSKEQDMPSLTPASEPVQAAFDDDDDDGASYFSAELDNMQNQANEDETETTPEPAEEVQEEVKNDDEKSDKKPSTRFRRST